MKSANPPASPYGAIGTTPELLTGRYFVEDYALARDLASELEITNAEDSALVIKGAVQEALQEAMGPDIDPVSVLAVSSLVAHAKERALRRPEGHNEKELQEIWNERTNIWPLFSLKRLRNEHALLKDQIGIYEVQKACINARYSYLDEARSLTANEQ